MIPLPEPSITTALVLDEVGQQVPMRLVGAFYTSAQMLAYGEACRQESDAEIERLSMAYEHSCAQRAAMRAEREADSALLQQALEALESMCLSTSLSVSGRDHITIPQYMQAKGVCAALRERLK